MTEKENDFPTAVTFPNHKNQTAGLNKLRKKPFSNKTEGDGARISMLWSDFATGFLK